MEGVARKYVQRVEVGMYTGPDLEATSIEVCRQADGSLWLLGRGGCGVVYKVSRALVCKVGRRNLCAMKVKWHDSE